MKEFTYVITDEVGLHARPAKDMVKEMKSISDAVVTIRKGDKSADAKKLLPVMGLGAKKGDEITVCVEGGDEEAVFERVKKYFEENL